MMLGNIPGVENNCEGEVVLMKMVKVNRRVVSMMNEASEYPAYLSHFSLIKMPSNGFKKAYNNMALAVMIRSLSNRLKNNFNTVSLALHNNKMKIA
jgi:hypothetical protein